jgi:hypothetical protein
MRAKIERRDFITRLGGVAAAGSVFWPLVSRAKASSNRADEVIE